MSAKTFQIKIVTSTGVFLEDAVSSIILPGGLGYVGVLANHAPMVSTCTDGRLTLKDAAHNERHYQMAPGFLEVLNNQVTILTDSISDLAETHA